MTNTFSPSNPTRFVFVSYLFTILSSIFSQFHIPTRSSWPQRVVSVAAPSMLMPNVAP